MKKYLIREGKTARAALRQVDKLGEQAAVLFVVGKDQRLLGSLTDGDIRRGLLRNLGIDDKVERFMNKGCHYLNSKSITKDTIKELKLKDIKYVPQVDKGRKISKIVDLSTLKSILPIDVIIMAGGRGERLMPLTENIPKPLLLIGSKPLLEHNIDTLINWGITNITITVRYLGNKIIKNFGDGSAKGISIRYVTEDKPLGTMGAVGLINDFKHSDLLLMNSDLLTNFDLEHFYERFLQQKADMLVATIPYRVNIPYAVVELGKGNKVKAFTEKPRYTYHSNAGIYLMKKEIVKLIPKNERFDATDMMNLVISKKMKLVSEPILAYWLDIGNIADYGKAQEDVKNLKF